MDISLSGLLTYIESAAPGLLEKKEATQEDLCFSLQVKRLRDLTFIYSVITVGSNNISKS